MPTYCVNKSQQDNGDHEVHDTSTERGCLPSQSNRQNLGFHSGCASAVSAARSYFAQVNGCANCAPACHTS